MEIAIKITQILLLHAPLAFLSGGLVSVSHFLERSREKRFSILSFLLMAASASLSYIWLPFCLCISPFAYILLALSFRSLAKHLGKVEEGLSIVSLLIGVGVGAVVMILKGVNVDTAVFMVNVVGMGFVVYMNYTYSIVPDMFIAVSFLSIFVPDMYFHSLYSLFLLVSVSFVMNELMSYARLYHSEEFESFIPRFQRFSTALFIFVMIFAFFVTNLLFFESMKKGMEGCAASEVKNYLTLVANIYTEEGENERLISLVSGPLKPNFVKEMYVIKNGKVVYPFEGSWREISEEIRKKGLRLCEVNLKGLKVVATFIPPVFRFVKNLLFHLTFTTAAILLGAFFIQRQYYRNWTGTLELEINRKTQELTAANEELTAMNEELLSMNEEIENMYENLSSLNTKIIEFLRFLREVKIKDPIDEIFHHLYETISGILSTPPVGYEVAESDTGNIIRSHLIGHGEYSHDVGVGKYIFRVIYPNVVKFSEDEGRFIDIIATVVEIMVLAHESYEALEKSKEFSARILELLNRVLVVDTKEDAESLLLRYGMELFDDITSVAIAWKEELKEEVIVKIMRRDGERICTSVLKRGIIKYSMITGEEYLVRDVDEDEIFYRDEPESRSALSIPLRAKEGVVGVFEIERSNVDAFTEEDIAVLRIFARIVAMTMQRIEYLVDLKKTFLGTVEALTFAIELKDPYTHGHSRRVADYAIAIAKALGLSREQIEKIELAALLHDIGKIGVKGAVLDKPARLTEGEYEEIKKHTVLGEELVKKVETLRDVAKIIRHHHERCDGRGYPDGLTCDEIPFESKILAVADAFDAMTSDRPYRKAFSVKRAIEILESDGGKQWDPGIVRIAVKVFREMFKERILREERDREGNNTA